MSDYFDRRDIQNVTAFTDVGSLFDFRFQTPEQLIFNEAGAEIIEISWDGVDVHGRLGVSGPTSAIAWDDHLRSKVYVRRTAGPGGGAMFISVWAVTR